MNFNRKDVLIGFAIIIVFIAGSLFYKKYKTPKPLQDSVPVSVTYRTDFEDSFNLEIPDNVNTLKLNDISGGDARGMATEKEILVDANDPDAGYYYEGWLQNGEKLVSIGKLIKTKGGWILEYDKNVYDEFNKILVSLERVYDNNIEKKILEGSF